MSIGDTELAQTNLVTINPLLERAQAEHYAVGAFNGCDSETIQAAIEEADARRSPVIIIVGPWELPLAGPGMVAEMTRFAAAQTDDMPAAHLPEEIEAARHEGIRFHTLVNPIEVVGKETVSAVRVQRQNESALRVAEFCTWPLLYEFQASPGPGMRSMSVRPSLNPSM